MSQILTAPVLGWAMYTDSSVKPCGEGRRNTAEEINYFRGEGCVGAEKWGYKILFII